MITFHRHDPANGNDAELIRWTITQPRIWAAVADDGAGPAEDFRPVIHPAVWYMGAYAGEDYLGLFQFSPANSICWEVHTCLLPKAWGRSVEAAKAMAEWIFAFTGCRRIITSVPVSNRLALRLARNVGFERWGLNEASWLKNGVLEDQICLGLSKPEEGTTCQ